MSDDPYAHIQLLRNTNTELFEDLRCEGDEKKKDVIRKCIESNIDEIYTIYAARVFPLNTEVGNLS